MSSNNNNREDPTKQTTNIIQISATGPTITATSPASQMSITHGLGSTIAPTQSEAQLLTQTTQQQPFSVRNGSARSRGLVHSVSIIVEPALADGNDDDDSFNSDQHPIPSVSSERRNTIAGPYVVLEDFGFEPPHKAREQDDIVQSIIAHARLRKEEFARLLEEHAQIVNEINRAETSLL